MYRYKDEEGSRKHMAPTGMPIYVDGMYCCICPQAGLAKVCRCCFGNVLAQHILTSSYMVTHVSEIVPTDDTYLCG